MGIKNPDKAESDGTFTFQNLNYAKQKLFDPEIKYLTKKFEEQLGEIKNDLIQSNIKFLSQLKSENSENQLIL